jgi:three-Cys-motif partner protein
MAKNNKNFFKEKKPWSMVKDELLGCYFKPYIQKIVHTHKPVVYVDCFAGKGKFEDGNSGSPIIALDIINECIGSTTLDTVKISTYFIDLNHADELQTNLSDYNNISVISGRFEDEIDKILEDKKYNNVFLYIDPYGIAALQYPMFERFAKSFNSIELLINMNSFGFVREACHALGTEYADVDSDLFDDLIEYDSTKMTKSDKSINQLNDIAGGDYWVQIIDAYKKKEYDGYEAEVLFAEQYCKKLMESYKYVLNMPLRIKRGQRPKYRMIHATNHEDGCVLMVDNIHNRWQALKDIQNNNQLTLFNEDFENQHIDEKMIYDKVVVAIANYPQQTPINVFLAEFFVNNGAICSTSNVIDVLKRLEKENHIVIDRKPEKTKSGKPSAFFTHNSKQRVWIRSKA